MKVFPLVGKIKTSGSGFLLPIWKKMLVLLANSNPHTLQSLVAASECIFALLNFRPPQIREIMLYTDTQKWTFSWNFRYTLKVWQIEVVNNSLSICVTETLGMWLVSGRVSYICRLAQYQRGMTQSSGTAPSEVRTHCDQLRNLESVSEE